MTTHDAIFCRLRAARWAAQEVQAVCARTEAAQRGNDKEWRACSIWAEICAMRSKDWQQEAERV